VNRSLLDAVRGLLERTYRIRSGVSDLGPFVIGDAGYRALYGAGRGARVVTSADGEGARTLVRDTKDGVAACIYFPDAMIRQLEAHPPQRGVHADNLAPFATFVEEIDHLLVVAERSLGRRPVSLFELELHANVSKYLVAARFLAGVAGRLGPGRRVWLRARLFDDVDFCDDDPAVRERYRDAARWAIRLLDALPDEPPRRIEVLRRFHAANAPDKLRLISALTTCPE
jgi:hypothetical protein